MKCSICGNPVEWGDDLVFVGQPVEYPMCYWCFKREIIETARELGAQLGKAYYDRGGSPHIRFEPRTIPWL